MSDDLGRIIHDEMSAFDEANRRYWEEHGRAKMERAATSYAGFREHVQEWQQNAPKMLDTPEETLENWQGVAAMLWDMARTLGGKDHPPPLLPAIDSEAVARSALDQLIVWANNGEWSGSGDKRAKKQSAISLDAQAVGVFLEHLDWTMERIAEHLRCHVKSLTPKRCPNLAAAVAAHKARIDPDRPRPHGSKDAEGNLEAWEEG